ncbi:hypothetical protein V1506DRAFT_466069 [Lipomyces tetrasporus]
MSSEDSPFTSVSSIRSKWEQMAIGNDSERDKEKSGARDPRREVHRDNVRPDSKQQTSNGSVPTAHSISEFSTTTKLSVGESKTSVANVERDPSPNGTTVSSTPRQGPPPVHPKPQALTSVNSALARFQRPAIAVTSNWSTDGQASTSEEGAVSDTSATNGDGSHESRPPEIDFRTKPVLNHPSAAHGGIDPVTSYFYESPTLNKSTTSTQEQSSVHVDGHNQIHQTESNPSPAAALLFRHTVQAIELPRGQSADSERASEANSDRKLHSRGRSLALPSVSTASVQNATAEKRWSTPHPTSLPYHYQQQTTPQPQPYVAPSQTGSVTPTQPKPYVPPSLPAAAPPQPQTYIAPQPATPVATSDASSYFPPSQVSTLAAAQHNVPLQTPKSQPYVQQLFVPISQASSQPSTRSEAPMTHTSKNLQYGTPSSSSFRSAQLDPQATHHEEALHKQAYQQPPQLQSAPQLPPRPVAPVIVAPAPVVSSGPTSIVDLGRRSNELRRSEAPAPPPPRGRSRSPAVLGRPTTATTQPSQPEPQGPVLPIRPTVHVQSYSQPSQSQQQPQHLVGPMLQQVPTQQLQPYTSQMYTYPSASTPSLPTEPTVGDEDSYMDSYSGPEMMEDDSDDNFVTSAEETERLSEYPDSSRANRRPPILRSTPHEIHCKYDVRVISISGEYIITSSTVTKVWSVKTGSCIGHIGHPDLRVTAIAFKPSLQVEDEGSIIWLGTRDGGLLEADIRVLRIVNKRTGVHASTIKGIYRCGFEMWTLDEDGRLQIWGPDERTGLPQLNQAPKSQRIQVATACAIVVSSYLWVGRAKQVTVYQPSFSQSEQVQFTVTRPLTAMKPAGDITCAAVVAADPEHVYFGHDDGKVSVYSRSKLTCVDVVGISLYKITAMAGVGNFLWVSFRTGMIYVYDVSQRPWIVMKDWKAHDGPIQSMAVDRTSIFKLGTLPVITMTATENILTIWDGMLKQDWLELSMQEHEAEYCSFRTIQALICTWNVGAAKPTELQQTSTDSKFLRKLLKTADDPELIVFGFQELVELDNKTVTAKSMFKHKKKNKDKANVQQHMSYQYKAWQDHLTEAVSHLDSRYVLLTSDKLVGLYTCIFIKEREKHEIGNLRSSTVKTGLGGLHGNKGAIIVRFTLDDSSICFVNCHLAAGQSNVIPRNNDIANIMEAKIATAGIGSTANTADIYVGGGDGSMILDHEICFVNGDMNYRITLHRVPVMKLLEKGELDKLLESDQLLSQLKKNPGFRLRPFSEFPITFPPTYKYDIGSDTYDSSEKKRTPAWCDRIYYRGPGKIFPIEYRTYDVRVSDHRPVSGLYDIKIKTVDWELRKEAMQMAINRWEDFVQESIQKARLHFHENEQRIR